MPHEDYVTSAQSRRISFPPSAIFQSVIQDGDNQELWVMLQRFQQLGLDIDQHNHTGITPLHQCVLNNNLDGVKMLLNVGADINVADSNGLTPLHSAAACGFLQMASILILFGADIFAKANDDDLPVDYSKDTDMSDLLQTQMINVIQVREYVNSYILYQGREWIIWILRMYLWNL